MFTQILVACPAVRKKEPSLVGKNGEKGSLMAYIRTSGPSDHSVVSTKIQDRELSQVDPALKSRPREKGRQPVVIRFCFRNPKVTLLSGLQPNFAEFRAPASHSSQ